VPSPGLRWQTLHWRRPLDAEQALACLRQWAADERSPRLVLEVRGGPAGVRYLLGVPTGAGDTVSAPLGSLLGTAVSDVDSDEPRSPVMSAGRLSASTRHRALRVDEPELAVRALLAALHAVRPGGEREELVLQVVLGPRRVPLVVPTQSPSSLVAPWWQVAWRGDGGRIDSEKRSALRLKVSDHGFACTVRLGVRASSAARRRSLLLGLLAALRTTESPGVRLRLRAESPRALNDARAPWRWPLRLGVRELLGLTAWPLGRDELPGIPALHPRPLPPESAMLGSKRIIGDSTYPGVTGALSLPLPAALQHLHVLGPTGVGKSTLLLNLITADLEAGRGVVVVEPKGDLVRDVLARVPTERTDDVVVLDATDDTPIGLNPLTSYGRKPELVADGLLSIFKQLYGGLEGLGPRSSDILYAGLLTLARRGDASLVMLPLLLTNPSFRRSLTGGLRDPFVLEPFWATLEAWSDAERAAAVAPLMNKLRPLLRPGLRAVLGQRSSRFDLRAALSEGKVLLVPLQRGVLGPDAASLLGSLVLSELWGALQGRSRLLAERRRPVMVYVDEVQDYLHLPTDLGEALAQARGYGVGFTLAHQFLAQLPPGMRSAVLANARSRVCFQLAPDDAAVIARGRAELAPEDLTALGPYEVYLSLVAAGQVTPYASGRTRPPVAASSDERVLRERSRERFGRPLDEVEASFAALADEQAPADVGGRRRRAS
jgi:hypothetical protein